MAHRREGEVGAADLPHLSRIKPHAGPLVCRWITRGEGRCGLEDCIWRGISWKPRKRWAAGGQEGREARLSSRGTAAAGRQAGGGGGVGMLLIQCTHLCGSRAWGPG